MGTVRLVLALIVAAAHFNLGETQGFALEAIFAVRAFFVISGFYMAMVICERYAARGPFDFYASRFLKLLPIYLCVAAVTVVVAAGLPWRLIDTAALPWPVLVYGVVAIVSLVGVDLFPFFALDPASGTISFSPDRAPDQLPGSRFLPVGQTWSIGLELWFYLLAPLVVRRSVGLIVAILAISIAARYAFFYAFFDTLNGGLPQLRSGGRWFLNRAVFPFELAYFMLGVLAYRLLRLFPATIDNRKVVRAALAWIVVIVLCRLLYVIMGSDSAISTASYLALAAGIPSIFLASRQNRIDNMLGALSYPIYIVHVLLLKILYSAVGSFWTSEHTFSWTIIFLIVTVLVAWILDRLIAQPVDKLRIHFGARARKPDGAPLVIGAPIVG